MNLLYFNHIFHVKHSPRCLFHSIKLLLTRIGKEKSKDEKNIIFYDKHKINVDIYKKTI